MFYIQKDIHLGIVFHNKRSLKFQISWQVILIWKYNCNFFIQNYIKFIKLFNFKCTCYINYRHFNFFINNISILFSQIKLKYIFRFNFIIFLSIRHEYDWFFFICNTKWRGTLRWFTKNLDIFMSNGNVFFCHWC